MEYSQKDLRVIWLDSFQGLEYRHKKILVDSLVNAKDLKNAIEENKSYIVDSIGENVYKTLFNAANTVYIDYVMQCLKRKNVEAIAYTSQAYPERLLNTSLYPLVLYVKGDVSLLNAKNLGMVGSRKSLPIAISMAREFTKIFSKAGFVPVTGIAEGVDTAVIKSALSGNGKVVSVVAGGFDHVYPAANASLVDKIAEKGLVVAEFPPEIKSERYMFPVRNRIIAGLSDGVLVVSAGVKSGTFYTADYAVEYGRDLFAVPYGVGVESGEGCNALIKRGAMLCDSPDDILDFYGVKKPKKEVALSPDETLVLDALKESEKHIEEISRTTGKPAFVLSGILSVLEIKGLVAKTGVNVYGLINADGRD